MTDDLSPKNAAAFEASLAAWHAMVEERDNLKAGLTRANEEIVTQRTMLAGKELENADQRARFDRELGAARAETERARTELAEAQAQRVALETILRQIGMMIADSVLPHDPAVTGRLTAGEVGIRALATIGPQRRDQ